MTGQTPAAPCAYTSACPVFAVFSLKSSLKVWQGLYCESQPARCERLRAFQAGQPCPDNLLPNGKLISVPLSGVEPLHFA